MSLKKYLAIVEGKSMECEVLEYGLSTYGFQVNDNLIKDYKLDDYSNMFTVKCLENRDKQFVILQSNQSRIKDFINTIDKDSSDISRLLVGNEFVSIFLIFDIDHNTKEEIEASFYKFNEPSTGLLILSSPCFEVIAPCSNDKQYEGISFKKFKTSKSTYYSDNYHISTKDYIKYSFNELLIHHLKNNKDKYDIEGFQEVNDVTYHPEYIIILSNKYNIREGSDELSYKVNYTYFSSILYVVLLYLFDFARYTNSYTKLLDFLINKQKEIDNKEIDIINNLKTCDKLSVSKLNDLVNNKEYATYLFNKYSNLGIIDKTNNTIDVIKLNDYINRKCY